MTTTFVELKDKLKRLDEISLMELLGLTAEDLVERFDDIIEEKYDTLLQSIED